MPHHIAHFAVHADDVPRARRFYQNVFGWRFEPWGPPDFYLIHTGASEDAGIHGALQKRREPLTGTGVNGYECTVAVDDLATIAGLIEANGGEIVTPRTVIAGVGALIQFRDTEGNLACAMHYDERAS